MSDGRDVRIAEAHTGSLAAATALSLTQSNQPQALAQNALVNKVDAKQFPEMEAYVNLFRQITHDRIKSFIDPYEHWAADSNLHKSTLRSLGSDLGLYTGISKIKTVTSQMKRADPHNPFFRMIEGYLARHTQSAKGVALPTIKKLSKFILEGLGFVFLSIEIEFKDNPKEKIAHYKALRDLCLDLISHEKWSIDYNSWKNMFLTDHGAHFSLFIHKLILKLNTKLQTVTIDAKPDELKDYVTALDTHLKNALATSKEMLLRLISNEEIPPEIFHDDSIVTAFKTQDYDYFSRSTSIPPDIRRFIGNPSRHRFITDQFISPQHEATLKQVNLLAEHSAQQSIHQRQLLNRAEPLLLQEASSSRDVLIEEAKDEAATGTLSTATISTALVPTEARQSNEQFTLQKAQLKNDYMAFLDNKNRSFYLHIQNTVPTEIRDALITRSSTDSVVQAKHTKSKALILIIMDICSIIHQLEKDSILASNIQKFVHRSGIISDWFIEADFQTLAEDLRLLAAEINTTYLGVVEKSLDLRSEIQTLNQSQWSLNVNLVLSNVHTVLDNFNEIIPLLMKIKQAMSWQKKYEDFMEMMVYKRRITLQQEVFFGIEHSKSLFEEVFEKLIRVTFESAQIQRQLLQAGTQGNAFYLQRALALRQRQALLPAPTGVQVEVLPDEVELTLNDLEKAALTRHRLTIGQVLAGKIVRNRNVSQLEVQDGDETRQVPLNAAALKWIEDKQRAHSVILAQEHQASLGLSASLSSAPSLPDPSLAEDLEDKERMNRLSVNNTILDLQIDKINLELRLKDRRQDFSFRIFRPSLWWATGLGLLIHGALMIGAGLYRLANRNSINQDLEAHARLEEVKRESEALIKSNESELLRLQSRIEARAAQRLVQQQQRERENAEREARLVSSPQISSHTEHLPSLSVFAQPGALAPTMQRMDDPLRAPQRSSAFSHTELEAMSDGKAQELASQLIQGLDAKLKESLQKSHGNLTQATIIQFDQAFNKLDVAREIVNKKVRLIIYQHALDNLQNGAQAVYKM